MRTRAQVDVVRLADDHLQAAAREQRLQVQRGEVVRAAGPAAGQVQLLERRDGRPGLPGAAPAQLQHLHLRARARRLGAAAAAAALRRMTARSMVSVTLWPPALQPARGSSSWQGRVAGQGSQRPAERVRMNARHALPCALLSLACRGLHGCAQGHAGVQLRAAQTLSCWPWCQHGNAAPRGNRGTRHASQSHSKLVRQPARALAQRAGRRARLGCAQQAVQVDGHRAAVRDVQLQAGQLGAAPHRLRARSGRTGAVTWARAARRGRCGLPQPAHPPCSGQGRAGVR